MSEDAIKFLLVAILFFGGILLGRISRTQEIVGLRESRDMWAARATRSGYPESVNNEASAAATSAGLFRLTEDGVKCTYHTYELRKDGLYHCYDCDDTIKPEEFCAGSGVTINGYGCATCGQKWFCDEEKTCNCPPVEIHSTAQSFWPGYE